MSVPFRVEALELHFEKKESDRRTFHKGLNLLIGDPGSGKSTIIELIRFGLGLEYQQTPVVEQNVRHVLVDLVAGEHRLRLERSMRAPRDITVLDLDSHEAVGVYPVKPGKGRAGIGTALLGWMGVPTGIEFDPVGKRKQVVFKHVWEYMHIPQFEIDHSITRHDASSSPHQRKRVFELLFGLADDRLMDLEKAVNDRHEEKRESEPSRRVAHELRKQAENPSRKDVERKLSEAESKKENLIETKERIRSSLEAGGGRDSELRKRITETKNAVDEADEELERLVREQKRRFSLITDLEDGLLELGRVRTAHALLAPFEFIQCPRCLQGLDEGRATPGTCRLCLQRDHGQTPERPRRGGRKHGGADQLPLVIPGEATDQEFRTKNRIDQLQNSQIQDEKKIKSLRAHRSEKTSELYALTAELRDLRSYLDLPTSEELARGTEEAAAAGAEVERVRGMLEDIERAEALEKREAESKEELKKAEDALDRYKKDLVSRSGSLFAELSSIYDEMLKSFATPNVEKARIDPGDFLPYIDGKKFDAVTISGGNRAPFIVGYWLTLQEQALTDPRYPFPGFLILDSPQKSLGPRQGLSKHMYQRIQDMCTRWEESFQVFVLDTDLPDGFVQSPGREPTWISYENPGIGSIPHTDPEQARSPDGKSAGGSDEG